MWGEGESWVCGEGGWGGDQSLFAYNFHGDVVNLVPRSHSVFPLAVGDLGTRLGCGMLEKIYFWILS